MSHEETISQLSNSDLLLLPSIEEGISNAVLEAMILGVPVISTNCGGMVEVITNNKNGFIVPVRDPDSIAETIQNFINLNKTKKNKYNPQC